jgi:hypothetical protein
MKSIFDPYEPTIPETTGEVHELLGWMMLNAPRFEDKDGLFAGQSIETEFFALNEGWKKVRKKLGEERYARAVELTARMKALFEADPNDENGDAMAGRNIIFDLQDIIKASNNRKRKSAAT